jgi:hypothetical protein
MSNDVNSNFIDNNYNNNLPFDMLNVNINDSMKNITITQSPGISIPQSGFLDPSDVSEDDSFDDDSSDDNMLDYIHSASAKFDDVHIANDFDIFMNPEISPSKIKELRMKKMLSSGLALDTSDDTIDSPNHKYPISQSKSPASKIQRSVENEEVRFDRVQVGVSLLSEENEDESDDDEDEYDVPFQSRSMGGGQPFSPSVTAWRS